MCPASPNSCFFVRKINNRLLFSTFIYFMSEITNIISIIGRQAPENGVRKITVINVGKRSRSWQMKWITY